MAGASGNSFLALVYHNGKIKKRIALGVKFKSECQTNVFIPGSTVYLARGLASNVDHVGPTHCPLPVGGPITKRVASPSFDVNLPHHNDDRCELGDNHSFGELAVAMAATLQPPSSQMCHANLDPLVKEALRCNGSDEEPALIEVDSDDNGGTILEPLCGGAGASCPSYYVQPLLLFSYHIPYYYAQSESKQQHKL
ncbi:hypothetical protein PIB30_069972 [Stylosanthes scabra]|uniref:Uncharacterized protein n=1 Tax=Stylosanthes scabra TaxID=79078 RepID=A0ABU6UMU5_9FABA|nr:hypothetical protein [Stylosanthes scabra]